MADAIGPNMNVVCVSTGQNGFLPPWQDFQLTSGAIYYVKKVVDHQRGERCPVDNCGTTGVKLRGKSYFCLYCPNQFKPLGGDLALTDEEADIPEAFKTPVRICEPV